MSPRLGMLAAGILLLPGCLWHEARVECPASGPDEEGKAWIGFAEHALPATPPPSVTARGPKPQDLPVTWYVFRRDEAGMILRYEDRVRSPLPWWEHFPADLAVDFWPQDVTAGTAVTVVPREVPPRAPEDLAAEARAHGYAR